MSDRQPPAAPLADAPGQQARVDSAVGQPGPLSSPGTSPPAPGHEPHPEPFSEASTITPHMAPPPDEHHDDEPSEADKQAHPDLAQPHVEPQTEPDDHAPTHEGQEAVGTVPAPLGDNAAAGAEARSEDDEAREAAEKAEQEKAQRAEDGTTASQNGDFAFAAYAQRIEAAKFEHRNQGHDDTMQLLDDMFAGIQRLEAKNRGE